MNKNKSLLEKPTMVVIVAVLCCLLWGSAFPCIKLGYQLFDIPSGDSSSQILFAGIRFTLAGILVILADSMMQGKILKPSKTAIPKVLKLCMFQTVLQYIFFSETSFYIRI